MPAVDDDLPPVRTPCKIDLEKQISVEEKNKSQPAQPSAFPKSTSNEERIKSTDYSKWDKYDPDEEILRMDLEEERTKEQVQTKGRQIEKLSKAEEMRKREQAAEEQRMQAQLKKLTKLEREQYAEK